MREECLEEFALQISTEDTRFVPIPTLKSIPHATLRVSPTLEEDWVLIARGGQADCYALT